MSRRSTPLLAFVAVLLSAEALADGPRRPVGGYGGRTLRRDGHVVVLDVSRRALLSFDPQTLAPSELRLSAGGEALDPYGVGLPGDGTVWALADRGRSLVRFSEKTGARVEKRRLDEPCQGIADSRGGVLFVAVRLRAGEPLLLRLESGRLRPFAAMMSRPARDTTSLLIANLLRCGSGTLEEVPCWFLAGPPEVFLVSPEGELRRIEVPALAVAGTVERTTSDPGAAFAYPVRDVIRTAEGLWVLTNQEGDRTPLESGAVRGRHLFLVRRGRPAGVLPLPREARAVLDADATSVTVLYADGIVERVGRR